MISSNDLFDRAKKVIPGGVNSPVRAFRAVGSNPLFISRAKGSKLYDVEEREYIDYVCSWGPMILGHSNDLILKKVEKVLHNGLSFGAPVETEVQIAELIVSMVPGVEMVRMVNSGTEAVMSAIRLARGFTKRDKIIKFEGCYHGHSDSMLVKAGSGVLTAGVPDSLGVPRNVAGDTLTAVYNNISSVQQLFEENKNQIAAVIIEPVAANMGVIPPKEGFLKELSGICRQNSALLIFDEVITGFRLGAGGAQEYFGVEADIVTFGKIIGGGMPVGAYAGRKEIMEHVAPCGGVYQAGTLSGNPVAMAAGLAQLEILKSKPEIYEDINKKAEVLGNGLEKIVQKYKAPITLNRVGSLLCGFFSKNPVTNYQEAKLSNTKNYAAYFKSMLSKGIYLAPSQFEAMFVSSAHTYEDIDATLKSAEETLVENISLMEELI
ncbi:glutamate-1-semialdehyde-2,1-aminomutase [Ruminiclostridium papyrosolvens DSM 2782]|uniref:Glutamate-1-semialdehyde 2,1-aminomutase n=1 Tax=Ruminiclostridium papyrosolvens DSM 2782 TaxID=588581 RepID=F1T8W7_9FIRM|nr:glutamate-1-semialdehyde 2,1-aminomutase [Ruminiclostridium papyrosolvens]EGD48949.1 glutamate-1-semialdehyde-2,1-aminomutase [Ruminiclostridium papyrosolvens DSM 2782]WES35433.1 glutamate-1-semialdehyde 2,1-aminomutase [Ruminiclostridium papyrosolvens DSM 2782]